MPDVKEFLEKAAEQLVDSDQVGLDPQERIAQGIDMQQKGEEELGETPVPDSSNPLVSQNEGRNWDAEKESDTDALLKASGSAVDSAADSLEQRYETRYEDPNQGVQDNLDVSSDDAPAAPPTEDTPMSDGGYDSAPTDTYDQQSTDDGN